jgi:hypothetical protein
LTDSAISEFDLHLFGEGNHERRRDDSQLDWNQLQAPEHRKLRDGFSGPTP